MFPVGFPIKVLNFYSFGGPRHFYSEISHLKLISPLNSAIFFIKYVLINDLVFFYFTFCLDCLQVLIPER